MPEYVIYDVTVSLLTPLHIGTGRDLLYEYDYAIHGGKTWRINEDALLDAQDVDDPQQARQLALAKPVELIEADAYRPDSDFFRYVMNGTPRSRAEGAQLKEQIKSPFDQPYLPGSSLKGALRTAVAWYAWGQRNLRAEVKELGRSKKWAGSDYERKLLGKNPNHDLLRALQVSDSEPLSAEQLMVLNVRVLNRGGNLQGAPVEMEAIRPDTPMQLKLKLDLALFSDWAKRGGLKLSGQDWLQHLGTVVGSHSQDLARHEAAWFGQMRGLERVAGFYKQLAGFSSNDQRFLISLGWGTGWTDKTFGSRLQSDDHFMERILKDYRMARGRRERGDPFPKSRRVAVSVRKDQYGHISETPASPLGWALVEMKERKK